MLISNVEQVHHSAKCRKIRQVAIKIANSNTSISKGHTHKNKAMFTYSHMWGASIPLGSYVAYISSYGPNQDRDIGGEPKKSNWKYAHI
jgi:hypothetical protein